MCKKLRPAPSKVMQWHSPLRFLALAAVSAGANIAQRSFAYFAVYSQNPDSFFYSCDVVTIIITYKKKKNNAILKKIFFCDIILYKAGGY